VIDPSIESHYGTGYERSRLFPGGRPSLEYVRSMELLDRLLPPPPARLLDAGGGPGTYAAPLARRGYRVHLVDPVPLHVEQARQAAGANPAAGFTVALGDARELPAPDESQDAVMLFGPLYHLTEAAHRREALGEARRVLRPGGRLLAMAICRFASLLDGLYQGWLDDPDFRPIVDQDLADGQHRNPDPVGRPEFFTTAYFHTPDGLAGEIERAGFTGPAIYGVEGPGWPLRREWADPRRREEILFVARSVEAPPHRRREQVIAARPGTPPAARADGIGGAAATSHARQSRAGRGAIRRGWTSPPGTERGPAICRRC
jgi:SAM-dependent methyltransferase